MAPDGGALKVGLRDQRDGKRCSELHLTEYLVSSAYHYGDVAYVGGGFGVGIHNVLEAAVWDMPVIFGPNNQRFSEAQGLKRAEGGFEIHTPEDFEELITRFTDDAEYRKNCVY